MDPITTAIVAAIASGLAEVGKEGVLDAYKTLKSLLYRKFGSQSRVVKAVEDLENNPTSSARTAVLQEEVAKAGASQDPDLLRIANNLLQQINYSSSVRQSGLVAYGDANVQQQAGQSAYHASGRGRITTTTAGRITYGRTGLVVLMAIVLVAIFAFLIWQLFPSVRGVIVSITNPAPTPTPTVSIGATPADALTNFCSLVRANGSDYAYNNLYSDNLKQQVSPQQFNQQWGFFNNPLTNCIGTITRSSDTTASGTITAQKFPTNQNEVYDVTLVNDKHWKIDSMQQKQ